MYSRRFESYLGILWLLSKKFMHSLPINIEWDIGVFQKDAAQNIMSIPRKVIEYREIIPPSGT